MFGLFHSIHVWLSISFIVAISFLIKKTYKIINNILEKRIKDVISEIDNSVEILNESSTLFDEATNERALIEKKLSEAYYRAKHEDDTYHEKYISDLNIKAKNNKESFEHYLNIQYELSILNHKKDIIQKSLDIVLDHINKNIDENQHNQLIDTSIEVFSKKLEKMN